MNPRPSPRVTLSDPLPLCRAPPLARILSRIALPDCGDRAEAFYLTAEEKRALGLAIARDGIGAIEAFVKEREKKDPRIREKLRALKDELLRRAEALRERLLGDYDDKRQLTMRNWQDAYDALEAAKRETESRLVLERDMTEKLARDAVLEAPLVHIALHTRDAGKPSFFARIWAWVGRFLRFILSLLAFPIRLIARLFGVKPKARLADRKGHRIAVAGVGGVEVNLPAAALDDPSFRRAIRGRMRTMTSRERARGMWNRLLGREDYEDLVKRLMAEEARERAEAAREKREPASRELEETLASMKDEEATRKKALDDALKRLEAEREAELERLRDMERSDGVSAMKEEIVSQLADAGLVEEAAGGFRASSRLIDRFAEIVFAEEVRRIPSAHGRSSGTFAEGEGHFTREPMRTIYDVSHMDLIGTVLRARSRASRHGPTVRTQIYDDDVLVFREEREALHHVVIVMDRSGSMEDNDRITAAKRAVLALHQAVKHENPANPVDLIVMDTGIAHTDLAGVWASEPHGFTNTAGALKAAGDLLLKSRAERGSIYLITDGLPEAYTSKNGEDVASTPEKCLTYAVKEARRLRNRPNLNVTILLLEAHEDLYVKAAEAIAKEVDGRVVKTDPKKLAGEMLIDFGEKRVVAT